MVQRELHDRFNISKIDDLHRRVQDGLDEQALRMCRAREQLEAAKDRQAQCDHELLSRGWARVSYLRNWYVHESGSAG